MIILAELSLNGPASWAWVDTAAAHRRGSLPTPLVPLDTAEGDRLSLEVEWRRADWRVRRLVGHQPASVAALEPTERSRHDGAGDRTAAAGRAPARHDHHALHVGDLVVADIRFTHRPGARDLGRQHKARPCLVVDIDRHDVIVRPVFGSNSAVRREGLGRRIRDWRAAGLHKPSVVVACDHYVPLGRTGRRVGRLSDHDRLRLFGC